MEQPSGSPSRVLRLLRRLAGSRAAGVPVAMVEELFGPSRRQARVVVERQRGATHEAPAPGAAPGSSSSGDDAR